MITERIFNFNNIDGRRISLNIRRNFNNDKELQIILKKVTSENCDCITNGAEAIDDLSLTNTNTNRSNGFSRTNGDSINSSHEHEFLINRETTTENGIGSHTGSTNNLENFTCRRVKKQETIKDKFRRGIWFLLGNFCSTRSYVCKTLLILAITILAFTFVANEYFIQLEQHQQQHQQNIDFYSTLRLIFSVCITFMLTWIMHVRISLEVQDMKPNIETLIVIKESGYFRLVVFSNNDATQLLFKKNSSSCKKQNEDKRKQGSMMMHRLGICDNFINDRFLHSLIIEPMIEQQQQQQQINIDSGKSSINLTSNNNGQFKPLDRVAYVDQICGPFELVYMDKQMMKSSSSALHLFKSLSPRFDCLSMIIEEIKDFIGS